MGITVVGSPKSRLSLTTLSRYYVLEAHAQSLEEAARFAEDEGAKAELLKDALAARGRMVELLEGAA